MTVFLFAFSMKQHEDCEKLYFLQTCLFYFSYLNVQGIQREGQTSPGAAASLLCRCSSDTEAPGERCVILSFSFRQLKFWVVLLLLSFILLVLALPFSLSKSLCKACLPSGESIGPPNLVLNCKLNVLSCVSVPQLDGQ